MSDIKWTLMIDKTLRRMVRPKVLSIPVESRGYFAPHGFVETAIWMDGGIVDYP